VVDIQGPRCISGPGSDEKNKIQGLEMRLEPFKVVAMKRNEKERKRENQGLRRVSGQGSDENNNNSNRNGSRALVVKRREKKRKRGTQGPRHISGPGGANAAAGGGGVLLMVVVPFRMCNL
jgi:hypothetical protein